MIDFEQYIDSLTAYAIVLVKNYHDAEDLVQDTIAKALEKQHLFDGMYPRAWLNRIMFNLMVNKYRHNRLVQFVEWTHDMVDSFSYTVAPGAGEIGDKLKNTMSSIKDIYCEVLTLRAEGMSYEEISEVIQSPVGTVMSRLSRAKKAVQHELKAAA